MSRFVQVLGPATDGGGMTLDVDKLKQMLCEEKVRGLPVVVLAAAGPRGSGKTTLLSAVQKAIVASGAQSVGMGPGLQLTGVEMETQPAGLELGAQSAGTGPGTHSVEMGTRIHSTGLGLEPGTQSTGLGPGTNLIELWEGTQSAGMEQQTHWTGLRPETRPTEIGSMAQSTSLGPGMQRTGLRPAAQPTGLGPGTQRTGMEHRTQSTGLEPGTRSPGPGPERVACEADRLGSAGAAVWPELLPVTLPGGERAALLLLDTWGPFDYECPSQQRASVLLFSALISSTLVVQSSACSPVLPLGDLDLLAKLGAAVQDVRHCTALQDLVLLLRDWRGAAPAGRQADFAPLHRWAQSEPAAKRALQMMTEAADWYGEGDVLLFLVPDGPAAVDASVDPVALLAAPKLAKRFDTADVRAGDLAEYLDHLAAALATTPCDAASLLLALVEANQRMVARAAEPVYEEKMEQLTSQWQRRPVSEQDLQGAHIKAAHDALMTFNMSRKMDSESMNSEKVQGEFQSWLEEQYKRRREMMLSDVKDSETKAHEQGRLGKEAYELWMQDALNDSPLMTMAELIKTHDRCRLQVLTEFDKAQGSSRHSFTRERMELADGLEGLFRKFATKLDRAKEEAELAEAEKSRISSVEKNAEQLYRSIMEVVQPDKLSTIHSRVQDCAKLLFDSKTSEFSVEHKSAARKRLEERTTNIFRSLVSQANMDASNFSTLSSVGHPEHGHLVRGHGAVPGSKLSSHGRETSERKWWKPF